MLRNNKVNLIISIVAAIAIWVYVVTFINPMTEKTVRDVPVKLINVESLAPNGLTVSPSQAFTINVEVRGSRSDLSALEATEILATADMTGFPTGSNAVNVEINLPDRIELVRAQPQKIEVVVEDLVSVTKPITLTYSKAFERGVEPGFITVAPQEISVSGTKEMVDTISIVRATIDSDKLSDTEQTFTTKVEAYSKAGEIVYGVMYSQDEIDITARLCHTKEVPLKLNVIGQPAEGRTITSTDVPATVTIRGSENAIKDITEVTGHDIDIGKINKTTIYTPDLNLPKDVELADVSQGLTITVEIGGIEAKNFVLTSDNILLRNVASGYTAHVSTGNLSVTVYGTKDQLAKFLPADLIAFVDLSNANLSKDTYEAEVQFEHSKNFTRIECQPAAVKITILKPPTPSINNVSTGTSVMMSVR